MTLFKAKKQYFVSYSYLDQVKTIVSADTVQTSTRTGFANSVLTVGEKDTDLNTMTQDLMKATKLQGLCILFFKELEDEPQSKRPKRSKRMGG